MPVGQYNRGKRGPYKTRYHGSCYCCGTTQNKEGYNWYKNYDAENNALCGLCYRRLILNPKWGPITRKKWNPICSKRKQTYKCGSVYLGYNPRKGFCFKCAKFGRTEMAHLLGYFDDDPTFGTFELCVPCHRAFDAMMRRVPRSCYGCGTTIPQKSGWYYNKDSEDNVICGRCHMKYIYKRKEN